MKTMFKRLVLAEIIVLGILAIIAAVLFTAVFPDYYTPHLFFIPPLLLTASLVLFRIHGAHLQGSSAQFAAKYMMANGAKMMVYLVAIVIYAFAFPENAYSFLITFLVCYFGLTVVEVVFVLRLIKRHK